MPSCSGNNLPKRQRRISPRYFRAQQSHSAWMPIPELTAIEWWQLRFQELTSFFSISFSGGLGFQRISTTRHYAPDTNAMGSASRLLNSFSLDDYGWKLGEVEP
jgi:hypothetical protein